MILSPAKTLDLSTLSSSIFLNNDNLPFTLPDCSLEKTAAIARIMKNMSKNELARALKLSPALAELTHTFYRDFQIEYILDGTTNLPESTKPCIFTYSGAAFQGIQINDCDVDTIKYMQENLRILDALYGLLRPLDRIQPYRLEMDTKSILPHGSTVPVAKLSAYWSEPIAASLTYELTRSNALDGQPILLNLASEEYSAAVRVALLPSHCRYIKVVFWEDQRVVAVHAKRARGLMVRFLSKHKATTLEDILKFDVEGYEYMASMSDRNTLVFNRSKLSILKTKVTKDSENDKARNKRHKHK
jgi:uncharacterized protein